MQPLAEHHQPTGVSLAPPSHARGPGRADADPIAMMARPLLPADVNATAFLALIDQLDHIPGPMPDPAELGHRLAWLRAPADALPRLAARRRRPCWRYVNYKRNTRLRIELAYRIRIRYLPAACGAK